MCPARDSVQLRRGSVLDGVGGGGGVDARLIGDQVIHTEIVLVFSKHFIVITVYFNTVMYHKTV